MAKKFILRRKKKKTNECDGGCPCPPPPVDGIGMGPVVPLVSGDRWDLGLGEKPKHKIFKTKRKKRK